MEKVVPLSRQLAKEKDENLIIWGLYKIAVRRIIKYIYIYIYIKILKG